MALVVRDVDDAAARADCGLRALDVLLPAVDLAENGIERMLQGAVHAVALRGAQLVQVAVDAQRRLPGRFVPAARRWRKTSCRESTASVISSCRTAEL